MLAVNRTVLLVKIYYFDIWNHVNGVLAITRHKKKMLKIKFLILTDFMFCHMNLDYLKKSRSKVFWALKILS